MKLIFSNTLPCDWRDLQEQTARLLNQAGYRAISPYEITTARGKVEVDVFVESPDVFVKRIICECKFWDTAVPKEKVHAFRTVVSDSGASLGLMITKTGFQSGAIEAAKYSNVQLITWAQFLSIIEEKWIISRLRHLKCISSPLSYFFDPLDFPVEKLLSEDKKKYIEVLQKYSNLYATCRMITKTVLQEEIHDKNQWYAIQNYTSIEEYILFLIAEVERAITITEQIVRHSNIVIEPSVLKNPDGYLYMFLD